jgi:hypothetical protein
MGFQLTKIPVQITVGLHLDQLPDEKNLCQIKFSPNRNGSNFRPTAM